MDSILNLLLQNFFVAVAIGIIGCSFFLYASKRGSVLIQFFCLALLDFVILVLGAESFTGAALTILFVGTARVLGIVTLTQLCAEAKTAKLAGLSGIGQRRPVTALLFAFSLFAALGISPFLTPDAKVFVMLAAFDAGNLPGVAVLVLSSIFSLVVTIGLVQALWLDHGAFSFAKEPFINAKNLPALVLALALVLMGVYAHDLTAFVVNFAGLRVGSIPHIVVEWNLAGFVLFGAALAVTLLRNVSRIAAYALGLVAFVAAGFLLLSMIEVTPLARLFAAIITVMGGLVWLYSYGYFQEHCTAPKDKHSELVYSFCFFILFGALFGLATAKHSISFFVFWELMTASSYVLISLAATKAAGRAAKLYFIMSASAAAFLLPAILFLAQGTGSFYWAEMSQNIHAIAPASLTLAAFACLIGFGVKAGLVPAHAWLPAAHPAAPSSISAPLSGVLTKAGIFGLILVVFMVMRSSNLWQAHSAIISTGFFTTLTIIGAITMIYGELMALMQKDIKRLFAYSTIGQIGEITLTLSVCSILATTGVLFHVLNHAIMKDLLFLASGAMILRAGGQTLHDLKGLGKKMPFTVGCTVIGLLSIMGLPPFAGFMSKYMMIVALAEKSVYLAGLMLLASLAGCVYYMRIIRVLVFEPCAHENIVEAPLSMRVPLGILAGLCILFGIMPKLGLALVVPVVGEFTTANPTFAFNLLPQVNWQMFSVILLLAGFVPFIKRDNPKFLGLFTAAALFAVALCVLIFRGSLDSLSFAFAMIVPLIGAVNMYYASDYMSHSHAQWRFYSFFLFMCAGLIGVATSRDLFTFFVFWEIMSSWSLYFVIVHEENAAALKEGFKYFFFNVLGAAFIFLGIATLSTHTGTLEFATLASIMSLLSKSQVTLIVSLIAIGFVMKAAQLPFRIDVQMHPATAPTPVSGYISSVLLKSALFGLAKLFFALGGLAFFANTLGRIALQEVILWVGGITIVMAAVFAVFQSDVKRMLIYSTVSQLGYMVLALALCTSLGVAGGLLHLANHVLFKNLLFLVAGALILQTGKHSLDEMGALATKMPKTFVLFAIGAMCVIGVPPSNGFTSKWIIYHALMEQGYVLLAILSLVGSVLTLAYFTKFMHKAFLGQASAKADIEVIDPPKNMILAMNVLAIGCIITSVFPGVLLFPINIILGELALPQLDIALWGIASGRGAWNATTTSIFALVLIFGSYRLLASLTKKRRISEIHTCGIAPEDLQLQESSQNVYTTPAALAKNAKNRLAPKTF